MDAQSLRKIFERAKEKEATIKYAQSLPTLKNIWALVANQFPLQNFTVEPIEDTLAIIAPSSYPGGSDQSIDISDNGNGTFSLNYDRSKIFNEKTPEEILEALGRFCGRHTPII